MKNLLIILVFIFPLNAFACKCLQNVSDEDRFKGAKVVMFVQGLNKTSIEDGKELSYFKVLESFKGPAVNGKVVQIDTMSQSSCEGPTETKYKFLLFSYIDNGKYGVSVCGAELFERVNLEDKWYGPNKDDVEKRLVNFRKLTKIHNKN